MRSRILFWHAVWLLAIYGFHVFMAFEKGDFDNLLRISIMMMEFTIIYLNCKIKIEKWAN
jgi:hypothetical protein